MIRRGSERVCLQEEGKAARRRARWASAARTVAAVRGALPYLQQPRQLRLGYPHREGGEVELGRAGGCEGALVEHV
eukprot:scaffold27241_cov114-Isochrysis_galbana.AAC.2